MTATRNRNTEDPADLRVSFTLIEKVMGFVIAAAALAGPSFVTYVKSDFRLAAVEKQSAETAAAVSGTADHEKRITRLEGRQEETEKAVVAVDRKVDHAITILERIDRRQAP